MSKGELDMVLQAIITILANNKKSVDQVAQDVKQTADTLLGQATQTLDIQTKDRIKSVLMELQDAYSRYEAQLKQNSTITRDEIQKAIKAQNERAFQRLQALVDNIKMPADGLPGQDGADGKPGKDGSPDTPPQVRDKLETLQGNERLDASAIKGLPDYFKLAKRKGKDMLVGGIRFFENLADVSIIITNKRQDLLAQYSTTNNRWEDGLAFTVSDTAPINPKENDVWLDIS